MMELELFFYPYLKGILPNYVQTYQQRRNNEISVLVIIFRFVT